MTQRGELLVEKRVVCPGESGAGRGPDAPPGCAGASEFVNGADAVVVGSKVLRDDVEDESGVGRFARERTVWGAASSEPLASGCKCVVGYAGWGCKVSNSGDGQS